MIRLSAIFGALALVLSTAQGQWYTKTYSLKAGWNGIWLSGDASHTTVEAMFASADKKVSKVWRWNPNPDQTQFIQDPTAPVTQSDEWTPWSRGDSTEKKLVRMVGNSGYLLYADSATTVSIPMRAVPPSATWLISGGNLLGFPALGGGSGATITNYLSSMIAGGVTGLPAARQVYKYAGGELGTGNPVKVTASTEKLDPDTAYWFNYPVVSDFEGPLHYEVASTAGLAFGRTEVQQLLGITNRTTSALTLTFTLGTSDPAPTGQQAVVGGVPLQRMTVASDGTTTSTDIADGGSFNVVVAASSRVTLTFAVNRSAMTGSGLCASILRVKDSAGLSDVRLPVSALPASTAGLWMCNVTVNAVSSAAAADLVPLPAGQTFPVNYLIHIDDAGTSRVLRQAFVGKVAATSTTDSSVVGDLLGIALSESLIEGAAVSDVKPVRYFAPTMPYFTPSQKAAGTVVSGGTVNWTLTHAHNDPANPFFHTYHPDHDNRDAKFTTTLAAGVESFTVTRGCSLTFATGASGISTVLKGTYAETISGLHAASLRVGGTFHMRRLSEVSQLTPVPTDP